MLGNDDLSFLHSAGEKETSYSGPFAWCNSRYCRIQGEVSWLPHFFQALDYVISISVRQPAYLHANAQYVVAHPYTLLPSPTKHDNALDLPCINSIASLSYCHIKAFLFQFLLFFFLFSSWCEPQRHCLEIHVSLLRCFFFSHLKIYFISLPSCF